MTHQHSVEEVQEQAALYALGALRGDDRQTFEAHLLSGCPTCAAEVQGFHRVTAELAYIAAPEQPPASLRERALANFSPSAEPAVLEKDGLRIVRSRQVLWEPSRAPAIEVKNLHVDSERGLVTKLVRMAPGAKLIAHRHADIEESYVLEGDLLVAGVLMQAGDYCRAEAGSVHTDVSTSGGCVFIAVQSQNDEWLTT